MTRATAGGKASRHLFGPVPSRRLGRSLGIDLVPHKVCPLDCVYCECGETTDKTFERREWVPTNEVLTELTDWIAMGGRADHLTFSGAGEPTLHLHLGEIARFAADHTAIPLALITNATLFVDPRVRAEVSPCQVILPSLDAADEESFARINRPLPGLTAATLVEGLVALRREYSGAIWLEILLIEGFNDSDRALAALAQAVERIAPDRVQLNTAVRPGTVSEIEPAGRELLERAQAWLGPRAEPVANFKAAPASAAGDSDSLEERLMAIISRRPENPTALAAALDLNQGLCDRALERLVRAGRATITERGGKPYVTRAK